MESALVFVVSVGFAMLGRWIQLHPERVVPKGYFTSVDSLGARVFRLQITLLGCFMVFGGVAACINLIASPWSRRSLLGWIAILLAYASGVVAAVYVRKEVRARPPYVSNTPYGWWP